MKIGKIIFIVFNVWMIFYYIYSFIFPVKTNFWIVYDGFPIIMLEFFSVFTMLVIMELKFPSKSYPGKSRLMITLMMVLGFAFIITLLFNNLLLYLYFILSTGVKFFYNNEKDRTEVMKIIVSIAVAVILSAFLAVFFSGIGSSLKDQNDIIRQKIIQENTRFGGTVSGGIINNPFMISIWGALYFILLTIFESFSLIRFQKADKNMNDSDQYLKELYTKKIKK